MATDDRNATARAMLQQAAEGFRTEALRTPAGPLREALKLLADDPHRALGDVIKTATEGSTDE